LRGVIAEVMGPATVLVDSAEATAEAVSTRLSADENLRPPGDAAQVRYFVTDTPSRFAQVATRFLGEPISHAEHVDITFA
jgi:glutamate racemase